MLPTRILDVSQLKHDFVGLLVPNVLGYGRVEALFPAPCLPLARHSPSIVSVRIHLVEDLETRCLFLSPHAREARLRHRALDYLFPVFETSPLGHLFFRVTMIGRRITNNVTLMASDRVQCRPDQQAETCLVFICAKCPRDSYGEREL